MLTFGAMVVELTCEKLQIENKTSDIQLPEHIKEWKTAKKWNGSTILLNQL